MNPILENIRNALASTLTPKHRAIGIDGSHWWGKFVYALARKPIDFIILKATEGTAFRDSALHANYQEAQAIPVRGMYHYQRAGMSWIRQAEFFLQVIEPYDLHILALDVEKIGNEVAFHDRAEADTFFGDMRRIIDYWRFKTNGKTVLLYTNPDIYYNHIAPAIKRLYGQGGTEWLAAVPKWIAVYNGQNEDGNPTSKWGIPEWMFWQFSSNGRKEDYGTQGDVDLNVYNGTVEEMQRRILGHEIPTQPPPPPPVPPVIVLPAEPETLPETWTGNVTAWLPMKIRIYPEVVAETETSLRLYYGNRVRGRLWEGNGYLWMKLDETNREDVRGKWVAVRRPGGDRYIRLDAQPAPPPPLPPTTGLFRVVWDDENPDYNYKCRTQRQGYHGPNNPPAVNRYYPEPIPNMGDFRVNLAKGYNWEPVIITVNNGDRQKFEYLTGKSRAMYNNDSAEGQSGWPKQAYLLMSGNVVQGEKVGSWLRFKTLKPSDIGIARTMTYQSHPQYVHDFTCVTWDAKNNVTRRIPHTGTARGRVFYFVVTEEGYGYIPWANVKPV